jgi:hypothetical protein
VADSDEDVIINEDGSVDGEVVYTPDKKIKDLEQAVVDEVASGPKEVKHFEDSEPVKVSPDVDPEAGKRVDMRKTKQYIDYAPEAEPLQDRYVAYKILKIEDYLNRHGVSYFPSWSGRQKHEAMLAHYREVFLRSNGVDPEDEPDVPPMPDEKVLEVVDPDPEPDADEEDPEVLRNLDREWRQRSYSDMRVADMAAKNLRQKGEIPDKGEFHTADHLRLMIREYDDLKALDDKF